MTSRAKAKRQKRPLEPVVGLTTLEAAVQAVVERHGGIRAASRATGVDKAFISRLLRGHKTAPSDETLNLLGLRAVPLYEILKPNAWSSAAPSEAREWPKATSAAT
jgi:hypothetical protein